MHEKYDLKKTLAEIEDDIDHETNESGQDKNISQPVITALTALKHKGSRIKKREKA